VSVRGGFGRATLAIAATPTKRVRSAQSAQRHGFDPAPLPQSAGPISLRVTGSTLRIMPCALGNAASLLARISPNRSVGQWRYFCQI
jgi:hypothetical protein